MRTLCGNKTAVVTPDCWHAHIDEGDARGGLPARVVGFWVHGHAQVECEECPPLQRVRHVLDGTAKLDEPCLHIVDAALRIQPALPPLQDASPLILELPPVSSVELVGENAAPRRCARPQSLWSIRR